jgi:hypothetical protein
MKNEIDESRPLRPKQFCLVENMSPSTYNTLKNKGLGPKETWFPGMAFKTISPKARAEWHKMLDEMRDERAMKIEHQRRVEHAKVAGAAAAASPLHVSKQKKAKARRRAG